MTPQFVLQWINIEGAKRATIRKKKSQSCKSPNALCYNYDYTLKSAFLKHDQYIVK